MHHGLHGCSLKTSCLIRWPEDSFGGCTQVSFTMASATGESDSCLDPDWIWSPETAEVCPKPGTQSFCVLRAWRYPNIQSQENYTSDVLCYSASMEALAWSPSYLCPCHSKIKTSVQCHNVLVLMCALIQPLILSYSLLPKRMISYSFLVLNWISLFCWSFLHPVTFPP